MAPLLQAKQEGNQGGATTWTISRPAVVATGELLVCLITPRSSSAVITGFDGWTQEYVSTGGGANAVFVLWKLVADGATEPTSYSLTATSASLVWVMWRISGAPASGNPINTYAPSGGNAANTTEHTLPAVTPTMANCLILTGIGSSTLSNASGWTNGFVEAWDIAVSDGPQSRSQAGAYKDHPTANVSTGATAVTTTASNPFSYFTFAIPPGDITPPAAPTGLTALKSVA